MSLKPEVRERMARRGRRPATGFVGVEVIAPAVAAGVIDVLFARGDRVVIREHLDLSWAATALTPIGVEARRQVTTADYLQTDDTPVTILEESGSRKGRIRTYLAPLTPQVVFGVTPTHEREPTVSRAHHRRSAT